MKRVYHLIGWGYAACCLGLFVRASRPSAGTTSGASVEPASASLEEAWFRRVKPYCNSVEVSVVMQQNPAPRGVVGSGFAAACFALAGRIDDARRAIDALPESDRYKAAGIVFNVGHPIADAGDDRAAGPIMELVVDYWPNHYMALYHAGMAEYMLGQTQLATKSLNDFLRVYQERDGWRSNAIQVLERMRTGRSAERKDVERPPEP
jgi:tetratricopeptide (TPR) repeat protein